MFFLISAELFISPVHKMGFFFSFDHLKLLVYSKILQLLKTLSQLKLKLYSSSLLFFFVNFSRSTLFFIHSRSPLFFFVYFQVVQRGLFLSFYSSPLLFVLLLYSLNIYLLDRQISLSLYVFLNRCFCFFFFITFYHLIVYLRDRVIKSLCVLLFLIAVFILILPPHNIVENILAYF